MKTLKDKLYDAVENLDDDDYKEFYFEWFGSNRLFDELRESFDCVDDEDLKAGLKLAKDIEKDK